MTPFLVLKDSTDYVGMGDDILSFTIDGARTLILITYIGFFYRYMLGIALVGKLCSILFFFLAWWFYRPPGSKNGNAVVPSVDLVVCGEKTNGNVTNVANGTLERSNGYCNAALECSDHL